MGPQISIRQYIKVIIKDCLLKIHLSCVLCSLIFLPIFFVINTLNRQHTNINYLSSYLSVCLTGCHSVCLFVCLSIYQSICFSIYLSIYLPMILPVPETPSLQVTSRQYPRIKMAVLSIYLSISTCECVSTYNTASARNPLCARDQQTTSKNQDGGSSIMAPEIKH